VDRQAATTPTSDPQAWLQLSAEILPEQASEAEAALLGAGAVSVTLGDAADRPVLEPAPGETPLWPKVMITGLFPGDNEPLALLAALQARLPWAEWRLAPLAERVWEREWLRDFRPMRFGRRLVVMPPGEDPPPESVILKLDPGLAFGTGNHATTALCLEWLDGLAATDGDCVTGPLREALVVDYGCGSGILAIAALLLGARAAIAVDIDAQALLATRDNASRNRVAEKLVACAPDDLTKALDGREAEVLVANILAGPLAGLLPRFAASLRTGGVVALSGILAGEEDALMTAAGQWFALDRPAIRDGWVRLSGQRKADR
jgi:ribosomal protein L11 methyltransferase